MRLFIAVFLSVLLICPQTSIFAKNQSTEQKAEEEIYIPLNLEDAIRQLKVIISSDDLEKIKMTSEADVIGLYHFGLGTGLRNSWRLWGDSRLSKWFNSIEIFHAEDMSGIIIISLHRNLNDKLIKLEEQVSSVRQFWEQIE
jgi:hypothetical protein